MYCQVLHLNGSGTLDYGDTEGTTVPPNIYYSTRVLLVLYCLSQTGVTGWEKGEPCYDG